MAIGVVPLQFDLIYDVGMNEGQNTEIYLDEGFRVLAIEADPELAKKASLRFEREIRSGHLTILNVGISDRDSVEKFWICEDNSEWSSFDRASAARNGCAHHSIDVQTRRFDSILKEFGIPIYLKIDIEGKDLDCLEAMRGMPLPKFISVEDQGFDLKEHRVPPSLERLNSLGYKYFNLVAQSNFRPLFRRWRAHYKLNLFERLVNSLAYGRLRMPLVSVLAEPLTFKSALARRNGGREFRFGSSGPWGKEFPEVG